MKLSAKLESFDTFWEAPEDIQKGYGSFAKFYKRNYFKYIPVDKSIKILVISCGPGYFVNLLNKEGYKNVFGIDSEEGKVNFAIQKGLNCERQNAFEFLETNKIQYDVIIAEQEINHLTLDEIIQFLSLCKNNLSDGGVVVVHSINGANPLTGIESLTQNIDHFNSFTEYSLKQVLNYSGFRNTKIFPLKLYIFFENPINYVGLIIDTILSIILKFAFLFYGKSNKIFTKKIAAVAQKS